MYCFSFECMTILWCCIVYVMQSFLSAHLIYCLVQIKNPTFSWSANIVDVVGKNVSSILPKYIHWDGLTCLKRVRNLPNSDIALWWGGALAWTLGCVFSWEHVVHVAWGGGSTSPPHTRPFDVKAVESLKHCRRPWLPCSNHPLLIKNAKKVWTRQHLMVAVLVFMRFTLAPMAPW